MSNGNSTRPDATCDQADAAGWWLVHAAEVARVLILAFGILGFSLALATVIPA